MNNFANIEYVINKIELFSYFSMEIFCLVAILLNYIAFVFLKKKYDIKRISDFLTIGAFIINFVTFSSIYIRNLITFENENFTFLNNLILFNNQIFLYKATISLFFIFFILCTYKITRKTRIKSALTNSTLLFLAPFCSLLFQSQNIILTFVLLEICAFLIYKFASNMRIKKYEIYSPNYIIISSLASAIFISSFAMSHFIKLDTQIVFANIVATIALLLKIGLFPIYNYTLNQHYKNNVSYSLLLFGLLPFLGIITLSQYLSLIDTTNGVYVVSVSLFILFTIFSLSLNAFKTKNLIKYSAYISYSYNSFLAIALLFSQNTNSCLNKAFYFLFVFTALYSLFCILKINLKPEKLNISLLEGFVYKNKLFCLIFAITLLTLTNVIPNSFSLNNLQILKELYLFDEIGIYAASVALIANSLILLNGIKIIKTMYSKSKLTSKISTKRTMLNYIVPLLILLFLLF